MAHHDPLAHRFVPDPKLVHRAHNMLLETEEQYAPAMRFVRQQWDSAFGATRVALDSLRGVWPTEARLLTDMTQRFIAEAEAALENAYHALDSVAEEMVGTLMVKVQTGQITTEEEFNDYIGESPTDRSSDG